MSTIYRKGTVLDIKEYNITCHQGGLGDLLGQLPAIKYVLDNHKNIVYNLWIHTYAVPICEKLLSSYTNVRICDLSTFEGKYNDDLPARSPYAHKVGNLSMHITNHAFITIAGREVEDEHKSYLKLDPVDISHFNLPKKYVAVATGFTSSTREWNPQSVKETTDYIISQGYTPVYLGKKQTYSIVTNNKKELINGKFKVDYSNGIDLIDLTNILEAHSILANAAVAIGVDNGLVPHLAAMSDVPIITGFTSVLPEHRLPYRYGVRGWNCSVVMPTEQELRCVGCQSKMTFANPSHSFTTCAYGDYKCVDLMSSDKWIEALKKVGV